MKKIMNRKGITPIIAVVLLLMMTVAAAGAAFFWITTIQSRLQGQIGTQAAKSAETTKQVRIISSECGHTTPVSINVTIQNVGDLTIDSGAIAIVVSDVEGKVIDTNTSTMSSNLESNMITTLRFWTGEPLDQNKTFGVKVTLPGGSEQTGTCIAK